MRVYAAFEHLKATDLVRVYHGTDSTGMREMLKFGVDATKAHQRHYNQGRERGLYVTPDLRTAKTFGNWILEFDVKARDLYPTQRWGLGSQRKHDLSGLLEKYVGSFRPLVSFQMNETREPQAMFIGYVPIRDVKHILTYTYSDSSQVRTLSTKEAAAELLDKGEDVPKWEQNMSAEDIFKAMCEEHQISREELLDAFTAYEDLDALVRDFRLPRKLGLRLKHYIEHKRKGQNMSITAVSRTLAEAGIRHVIVAAVEGKIKVTTKLEFPKGLDNLISDWHQDGNLRNRVSISDPTKLKVTNWLTKMINDPSYWGHPVQKPGYTWTIRIAQFGKAFKDPDVFHAKYTVELVDKKTRKVIYTRDDITGNELELVEVK